MTAVILDMSADDSDVSWLLGQFFERYSADEANVLLWDLFRGYAVNGPKEANGSSVKEAAVADLLDRLVWLMTALERERIR